MLEPDHIAVESTYVVPFCLSSDGTTSTASGDPVAEQTFGKYSVSLLKSREICPDFLVRTMRLRWRNGDLVTGTPGTGQFLGR